MHLYLANAEALLLPFSCGDSKRRHASSKTVKRDLVRISIEINGVCFVETKQKHIHCLFTQIKKSIVDNDNSGVGLYSAIFSFEVIPAIN